MQKLDQKQFGPWALITGASSGLGREFARQLAAAGLNLVLVARREALLREVGAGCARDHGVQCRVVAMDLAAAGFIDQLAAATQDLDIGLVVSNAGAPVPGKFLQTDRDALVRSLRLNAGAHLEVAHHFGARLARRGSGGLLLLGAMGAPKGIPYMANDSGAKTYVQTFARALHVELKPLGVHVTLLAPGPTETPVLAVFGLTPQSMPMRPMRVEPCVRAALAALAANRPLIIPGRRNRLMTALVPAPLVRGMMANMFEKSLATKAAVPRPASPLPAPTSPARPGPTPTGCLAPMRKLAVLMGSLFLFGGLLGLVPGVIKDGLYLGIFMVNPAHNLLHLFSGIMFIGAAGIGSWAARLWFQIFGLVYGVMAVIGLKMGTGMICGMISNNRYDAWGHAVLALGMLAIGFSTQKQMAALAGFFQNRCGSAATPRLCQTKSA